VCVYRLPCEQSTDMKPHSFSIIPARSIQKRIRHILTPPIIRDTHRYEAARVGPAKGIGGTLCIGESRTFDVPGAVPTQLASADTAATEAASGVGAADAELTFGLAGLEGVGAVGRGDVAALKVFREEAFASTLAAGRALVGEWWMG